MRHATLDLTPDLFVEIAKFCKDGPPRRIVVKENPLPDDAEIVRIRLAPVRYPETLQMVLMSATFPDVPDDEPSELPPVVFETQYDEVSGATQ